MKMLVGLILLSAVLTFVTYELGYGGGKREHGRERNGPFGGLPLW